LKNKSAASAIYNRKWREITVYYHTYLILMGFTFALMFCGSIRLMILTNILWLELQV